MASQSFTKELLQQGENSPTLHLTVDVLADEDEQQSTLITFYKVARPQWAAPLKCRLQGDAAIGKGVNRYLFSSVMHKVKNGFQLDLGTTKVTRLFDGQKDHLVPSASSVLVESDLFLMAGRMIGHSFIHGGPTLSGLSNAVVNILGGGTPETAASVLTLLDCPDMDLRETVGLLQKEEALTEEESSRLTNLCFAWDLPVPNSENKDWLFQKLLIHAVIGRVSRQIKQLRKGLKDTGLWPLLSTRADVLPILFPRETEVQLTSEIVLQSIRWPQQNEDSNVDSDDDVPSAATVDRVTGFFRTFIEEATPEVLRDLMKFWVGWEVPCSKLNLVLVESTLPTASTCFERLRLPSHYHTYTALKADMMLCLRSVDSGFGLV